MTGNTMQPTGQRVSWRQGHLSSFITGWYISSLKTALERNQKETLGCRKRLKPGEGEGEGHSHDQDAALPRRLPIPWLHLLPSGQMDLRMEDERGSWDAQEHEAPWSSAGPANASAPNL